MSIQTLRTVGTSTDSNGAGRKVAGLIGGLALAAVVAGGVVIARSNEQTHRTETAVVTSGHSIDASTSVLPAEPLGGQAEQTVIQQRLDDAAQANVMGGVAERTTLQAQAVMAAAGDAWACGTTPQRTAC